MRKCILIYMINGLLIVGFCGSGRAQAEPNPCFIFRNQQFQKSKMVPSEELVELEHVYGQFEAHVRKKDIEGLDEIMFHSSIPLFIAGKEFNRIKEIGLNGYSFRRSVKNTKGLELRISNTDFRILNGVASSWAEYTEVVNGNVRATGIDLFFYVNTTRGWKLAVTNNTYLLPDDDTDYAATLPLSATPEDVLINLVDAFNEKDKPGWLRNFKKNATLLVLDSHEVEAFSPGIHGAVRFLECASSEMPGSVLAVENVKSEIQDQYLSLIVGDYSVSGVNDIVNTGQLMLTLIGTPRSGWKVSAAAFTN